MAQTLTFLQLAPEFGGTRFGPFEAVEIRLGSDPANNDITLPEALGVAPQHVKILRQQDRSFILAPVDSTAPIFHFRAGSAKPKQVTAPLAAQNGDAFSLVSPEGPRFQFIVEDDPRAIAAAKKEANAAWGMAMPPSAGRLKEGMWSEIKRRGWAAVFTTRLGSLGMRVWTMVKSGSIFSPLYIVSGMLMMSGWMFAGSAACGAFKVNSDKNTFADQLGNCKDQLGVAKGADGDLAEPTVPELSQLILPNSELKNTLPNDKELYQAYAQALREVYAEPLKYRWVYTNRKTPYSDFKGALDGTKLGPDLTRVVSFAAASPTYERPWSLVNDSEGEEVCGRGVLGLTYRQAINLGMTNVQPDALVDRQLAESNDIAAQRAALDATVRAAGTEFTYRDDLIKSVGAEVQGGLMCLYVDGEDDRSDYRAMANAIAGVIGQGVSKNLPRHEEQHWLAARLVMLFAYDFKAHELSEVSFSASLAPSMALSTKNVKESRRNYAIRGAARLLARAAAVPCLARFDKDQREVPAWFLDKPPLLGSCAILRAYVEYDRL